MLYAQSAGVIHAMHVKPVIINAAAKYGNEQNRTFGA